MLGKLIALLACRGGKDFVVRARSCRVVLPLSVVTYDDFVTLSEVAAVQLSDSLLAGLRV